MILNITASILKKVFVVVIVFCFGAPHVKASTLPKYYNKPKAFFIDLTLQIDANPNEKVAMLRFLERELRQHMEQEMSKTWDEPVIRIGREGAVKNIQKRQIIFLSARMAVSVSRNKSCNIIYIVDHFEYPRNESKWPMRSKLGKIHTMKWSKCLSKKSMSNATNTIFDKELIENFNDIRSKLAKSRRQ